MSRLKQIIGCILAVHLCVAAVFAAEGGASAGQLAETAVGEDKYLSSYEEPISREEFCYLVISLMAELRDTTVDELYNKLTDKQKNESFVDVDADDKYIALAKKYELVVGKDGYVFSPDTPIKRQEVASVTMNLIRKNSPEYYDESFDYGDELVIEDHVEIAEWAKEAVDFMLYTELMKTDRNDNFDPTAYMTVEEAVMLISNVRVYLNTPLPEEPEEEPGLPRYVWIAGGVAAGVLVLVILIVLLCRRSKKKKAAKQAQESLREEELSRRLSPTDPRSAPVSPARQRPATGTIPPRPAAAPQPVRPAARPAPPASDEGETVFVGQVQLPRLRISGVQGIELDRSFELSEPLTIGRSEENVLQLPNSTISRSHCRIRWNGTQALLEDTGARNPVRILRGTAELMVGKSAPAALASGDILLLGGMRLRITLS